MNKFLKFMAVFTKISRFVVYFFLIINLCIDLFIPGQLLKVDLVWWITGLVLDTWYHIVVIKPEIKSCGGNCSDNCKSC